MLISSTKPKPLNSKVLIVEDCFDNLQLLGILLTNNGYEIIESDNGYAAIDKARTDLPDLILLDICMPNLNGFEVCRILKGDRRTEHIPIIFLSSLQEIENKTQGFQFGCDDYITKPFAIEEVLMRVENQIRKYHWQLELKAKNQSLEQKNRQLLDKERILSNLNCELNRLATIDRLTQIANRYQFDEFIRREWQRSQREKSDLSLIFIDIDYFKLYNDYFGHQAGDVCLQKVAKAIAKTAQRPGDLTARYGGEEFAVILPQTPANNALSLAEKIRQEVKKLNLVHFDSLVSDLVSLSLGVTSVVPSPHYTIKQFLVTADKALYQAKKQGRDRAVLMLLE